MKPKLSIIVPFYNANDTLEKALDSLPLSKDIQLILLDDGSTDNSWEIALKWWREHNTDGTGSIIHRWETNKGVATTMNLGFKLAKGEYIGSLSSDDWFIAGIDQFRPYFDGRNDLVYFNLEDNFDNVWDITPENKKYYPGAVKFIRREFLGNTRIPDLKWEEDVPFTQALYKKNPKEVFTGIVLKHYNWPREGSLTWQKEHQSQKNEQK